MKEFKLIATLKRSGQPRAYADSMAEYEVISNMPKHLVLELLMESVERAYMPKERPSFLLPVVEKFEAIEEKSDGYTIYKYAVKKPYTG